MSAFYKLPRSSINRPVVYGLAGNWRMEAIIEGKTANNGQQSARRPSATRHLHGEHLLGLDQARGQPDGPPNAT